jgi:hypothetical protein
MMSKGVAVLSAQQIGLGVVDESTPARVLRIA